MDGRAVSRNMRSISSTIWEASPQVGNEAETGRTMGREREKDVREQGRRDVRERERGNKKENVCGRTAREIDREKERERDRWGQRRK
jgi:hypothetical protein